MIAVETGANALEECLLFAMAVAESSGAGEKIGSRSDLDPSCVQVRGAKEEVSFRWSPETFRFESQELPAQSMAFPFSVEEPCKTRVRRILYERVSERQLRMTRRVIENVGDENVIFACAGDGGAGPGESWRDLNVLDLVRLVTASFAVLETIDEFEPHSRVARLARIIGVPIIDFTGGRIRGDGEPGTTLNAWDPAAFARAISELTSTCRTPVPRLSRDFGISLAEAVES